MKPNFADHHRQQRSRGFPAGFGWLILVITAFCYGAFVRATLYNRADLADAGLKGVVIPAFVTAILALWYLAATQYIGRGHTLLIASTYLPLLATLPITIGIFGSEDFAREYWINRSLKVQLLLGLPALVGVLQIGVGIWLQRSMNWRAALPILTVLALGLGLRWAGMGWGLPFAFQPEETSIYIRWAMEFALHE